MPVIYDYHEKLVLEILEDERKREESGREKPWKIKMKRLKSCRLGKKIKTWKPNFNLFMIDVVGEYFPPRLPKELQQQIKFSMCLKEIKLKSGWLKVKNEYISGVWHSCYSSKIVGTVWEQNKRIDDFAGHECYDTLNRNYLWKSTTRETKALYAILPPCLVKDTKECRIKAIKSQVEDDFDF